MINFLKIIFFFFIIILLMIPISLLNQDTKNQKTLANYSEEKIRETCTFSPTNEHFQGCFRREQVKILGNFTPLDALKIAELINETYRLDKYHNDDSAFNLETEILLYENWITFIESQGNIGVNRNDLSFFEITILPYARYKIRDDVVDIINSFKNNQTILKNKNKDIKTELRIKRIATKFEQLNI